MLPRVFKVSTLCLLCMTLVAADAEAAKRKTSGRKSYSAASGVSDPRYADLIVNPQTGEVYHQVNADAKRYPASLTKMMTLYMLFEALEKQRVTMNTRLEISSYAASMPQTNLALTPGDSIPVEIAIKALVVRSANDVAVVVAEALGGDVDRFADMMTAKARTLGMANTVFQNPNGLPNSGQYTTARDMAKLGIALKRDFPRYYPYFATRQFSWDGATYYTHNRVMLRYAGTDGIKTGFIGASGFNLVTSVTRGGRPLVGVVLGGASGAWRDNRMIQLLDESYAIVAARGAARGRTQPQNLPLSKDGKGSGGIAVQAEANTVMVEAAADTGAQLEEAAIPDMPEEDADVAPMHPEKKHVNKNKIEVKLVTRDKIPPAVKSVATVSPNAAPAMARPAASGANAPTHWGVQVGAFSSQVMAQQAAMQAQQVARTPLAGASMAIAGPEVGGAPSVFRARLVNLTEYQAKTACEQLIAGNTPCFIFKAAN